MLLRCHENTSMIAQPPEVVSRRQSRVRESRCRHTDDARGPREQRSHQTRADDSPGCRAGTLTPPRTDRARCASLCGRMMPLPVGSRRRYHLDRRRGRETPPYIQTMWGGRSSGDGRRNQGP
jgi:hypothetical protein